METFVEESYIEGTETVDLVEGEDATKNGVDIDLEHDANLDTSSLTKTTDSASGQKKKSKFIIQLDRQVEMRITDLEYEHLFEKQTPIIFQIMKTTGKEAVYAFKKTVSKT